MKREIEMKVEIGMRRKAKREMTAMMEMKDEDGDASEG